MTHAQPLADAKALDSAEAGPLEKAVSREQEEIVWNALQDIPVRYREPMVLFYRQQQSIKEVAAALDIFEDTAKQQLSRGRHMLKEQVAAIVEETLKKTTPGAMFAAAVVATLPAVTVEAASATAAGAVASLVSGDLSLVSGEQQPINQLTNKPINQPAAGAFGIIGVVLRPLLGLLGAVIEF